MIPCVNLISVKTDCDSPITCRLTWSAHANTPWPCKSHVAHFSFWSRFKPLHNSCGAKCLSNAQNTQSNLWRMKGKQEKTLSFLLWKACQTLSYQNSHCGGNGFVYFVLKCPLKKMSSLFDSPWVLDMFPAVLQYCLGECGEFIARLTRSVSVACGGAEGSGPWNTDSGPANGRNSQHVVCWPCQQRITTVNGLVVKSGVRVPAPPEVGCKHQMNTAGGPCAHVRVGQQCLTHVHNQTCDLWGRKMSVSCCSWYRPWINSSGNL